MLIINCLDQLEVAKLNIHLCVEVHFENIVSSKGHGFFFKFQFLTIYDAVCWKATVYNMYQNNLKLLKTPDTQTCRF